MHRVCFWWLDPDQLEHNQGCILSFICFIWGVRVGKIRPDSQYPFLSHGKQLLLFQNVLLNLGLRRQVKKFLRAHKVVNFF